MKLTSLEIKRLRTWEGASESNPLRAVVKLESEKSTVECVLSDESMARVLDLCAEEIAKAAQDRVAEFVADVTALSAGRESVLIGDI
jgi:hypothetical protein